MASFIKNSFTTLKQSFVDYNNLRSDLINIRKKLQKDVTNTNNVIDNDDVKKSIFKDLKDSKFQVNAKIYQFNKKYGFLAKIIKSLNTLIGRSINVDSLEKLSIQLVTKLKEKNILSYAQSKKFLPHVSSKSVSLASHIKNFAKQIISPKYADENKLLKCTNKPIEKANQSWYLNLALLRDAYNLTNDETLKNRIQFLINNYLDKSTPVRNSAMKDLIGEEDFNRDYQTAPYESTFYYRTGFLDQRYINQDASFNKNLGLGKNSPLILTETDEIEEFLPLFLNVVTNKSEPDWLNEITEKLASQLDKFGGNAEKAFSDTPAFLFDLTSILGPYIHTNNEKEKIELFDEKYEEVKKKINDIIDKAVIKMIIKFPFISKNKIASFLKNNTSAIARVKLDTRDGERIGGIKVLPLFDSKLVKADLAKTQKGLVECIGHTGIILGAVKLRKSVADDYERRKDIEYAVSGPNIKYFDNKEEFLKLNLFMRLSEKFSSEEMKTKQPHMAVLGKPTLELLQTLIKKISAEDWDKLNQDPATRMIIQTSLYKIKEQLAMAEMYINENDYTQYAQNIELIHCEIATLLGITLPYNETDFSKIHKEKLMQYSIVPKELAMMTTSGLNRSAVNTFAGLCSTVISSTPNPTLCYGLGLYYEEAGIVGDHRRLEDALKDPSITKVDFYACQTNPNIEIAREHTHYHKDQIIDNIKALLTLNATSDTKLTVVVDCTIENFESDLMQNILNTFKQEVINGKLNLIIFNSGVKFDMLGQDNYYGSPYFIINNGEPKWAPFNDVFKKKIYEPDVLSQQWFCLAYQNPSSLDDYRKLIFNNTKEIMKQIPETLKHDSAKYRRQDVFVSAFDNVIEPSFIDLKVKGSNFYSKSQAMVRRFYQVCSLHGVKAYRRGSFGFNHHNISWIPRDKESVSIRINAGLNPEENAAIVDFLNEIAASEQPKYRKINLDSSKQVDLVEAPIPKLVLEAGEFRGELYDPVPESVIQKIKGNSWREDCPVPLEDLAYVKVKHYDLDGNICTGEIVYHKNLAPELLEIFKELFEAKYPIEKMLLVDNYGAEDGLSMMDNNSYAFCYRNVTGNPNMLSIHSYGSAIDLNPRINPFIKNNVVQPEGGDNFVDRTKAVPGMIQEGDACYQIFTKHGYIWGGHWKNKDYHHFQKKGKDFLSNKEVPT